MRNCRTTDLPFNSRIIAPKPLDNEKETSLQNLKMKLNKYTEEYIEKTKRTRKQINLTNEQKQGQESLKEKKDENTIVINETEKSKRFACDTVDN